MTTIGMETYVRLGDQRPVLDRWLRDVGLLPEHHITCIVFGEGVHRIIGYERETDPVTGNTIKMQATQREDGSWGRLPVPVEWEWEGPPPPESVLARAREVNAAGDAAVRLADGRTGADLPQVAARPPRGSQSPTGGDAA